MGWISFDDIANEGDPGIVYLDLELIGIGVVDLGDRYRAHYTILSYSKEALGYGDAPFATAPEPVNQDISQGLVINFIGTLTVPIGNPQYFHDIFMGELVEALNINISITVFVIAYLTPG